MPNRMLRAELLESEAWLSLKDNADRSAWVACFLTADTLGNMPAGPHRMIKLWRVYGIETPEKVAKVLRELSDVDLIRLYQIGDKPYLHIPRFGQRTRFLGHLWPLSPWTTDEEKQRVAQKSPEKRRRSPEDHRSAPEEVEVEVEVEEEKTIPNDNQSARTEPASESAPDGASDAKRVVRKRKLVF